MNRFTSRFRRSLRYIAGTLLLGLLIIPLMHAFSASTVALDVANGHRLVNGPGAPTEFANSTNVQHGNVVQTGILVHNAEDPNSDKVAKNFKVKVTIPKKPSSNVTTTAEVMADNGASPAPYKSSDPGILNSANGQPFTVTNVRNLQLQRNNVEPTSTPTFNWGPLEDIPDSRVNSYQTDDAFIMIIQPNADGNLGPCFQNALRLVYLSDIQQAPTVSLNKQVRKAGETAWQEENTAKRGDTLEYQVRVANEGQAPATNVVIRDSLPPNVSLVPGSCKMKLGLAAVQACDDNFVNGGLKFNSIAPTGVAYILVQAKVNENLPNNVCWVRNTAGVKTDQTPEGFDRVTTNLNCEVKELGGLTVVKFVDANGNGSKDGEEVPQAGVSFTVTGPNGFNKTIQTGTDGTFSLKDLPIGDYVVTETVPTDFKPTTPNPQTGKVEAGKTATLTFGNQKKLVQAGGLHILKFEDVNADGSQGGGENPLANVSFIITGPNGFSVTKTTDASGSIKLTNLEPGEYTATETVPNGFKPTTLTTQNATVENEKIAELIFGNQTITTPTPTPTPTPPSPTPPPLGGPKGGLPVTGAATITLLSSIALAASLYLYLRERRALDEAIRNAKVKK